MMIPPLNLYEAILARRSVRRYDSQHLDDPTLGRVTEIISRVKPLIAGNQFHVLLRDPPPGSDLAKDLGGYGRIVNPPHYLVPYVLGNEHPLVDAGYRVEQIAVHLASLGIGSCFIGALRREAEVRALYELPDTARVASFLVFGRPSAALGGRLTNRVLRLAAGADRKLMTTDVFFEGDFDHPTTPPDRIAPLLEAARRAPSAVNAQPWRFLWREGTLQVFVTTDNRRYGSQKQYGFHDVGAAMANITLAMEALDLSGQWQMHAEGEPSIARHPTGLQPVATLSLEDGD
jgi:nitroreductase